MANGSANGNGNGRLTGLQQAFIDAYLSNGFNATQAAKDAGYQGNRVTLASVGSENLRKPQIRNQIDERLANRAMEADEVLMRLGDQARGSMGDFIDVTGKGRWTVNLEKAAERGRLHLIRRIKPGPRGSGVDLELYDSQSALVQIGKAHGLFIDRAEVKHEHDVVVRVGGDLADDL